MNLDRITAKLSQALGRAQSIALARDHQFIEALHVLQAFMEETCAPTRMRSVSFLTGGMDSAGVWQLWRGLSEPCHVWLKRLRFQAQLLRQHES